MAMGPNKQVLLNVPGLAYQTGTSTGGYDFIYEVSTVKSEKYNIGDHVWLPDGREFVYSKSAGAITTNFGCNFTATGYISQTVVTVADAIGSRILHVPAATHDALTVDYLRGGYVIVGNHSGGQAPALRQIIGNAAADANATFVAYLDAPLTVATVVGTTGVEVYQNPYAALALSGSVALAKAGIAATGVSAANMYFWVQIRGIAWTSPAAGVGDSADKGVWWRYDGSFGETETALAVTLATYYSSQYAGFTIEGGYSGNGPLVMLK